MKNDSLIWSYELYSLCTRSLKCKKTPLKSFPPTTDRVSVERVQVMRGGSKGGVSMSVDNAEKYSQNSQKSALLSLIPKHSSELVRRHLKAFLFLLVINT